MALGLLVLDGSFRLHVFPAIAGVMAGASALRTVFELAMGTGGLLASAIFIHMGVWTAWYTRRYWRRCKGQAGEIRTVMDDENAPSETCVTRAANEEDSGRYETERERLRVCAGTTLYVGICVYAAYWLGVFALFPQSEGYLGMLTSSSICFVVLSALLLWAGRAVKKGRAYKRALVLVCYVGTGILVGLVLAAQCFVNIAERRVRYGLLILCLAGYLGWCSRAAYVLARLIRHERRAYSRPST